MGTDCTYFLTNPDSGHLNLWLHILRDTSIPEELNIILNSVYSFGSDLIRYYLLFIHSTDLLSICYWLSTALRGNVPMKKISIVPDFTKFKSSGKKQILILWYSHSLYTGIFKQPQQQWFLFPSSVICSKNWLWKKWEVEAPVTSCRQRLHRIFKTAPMEEVLIHCWTWLTPSLHELGSLVNDFWISEKAHLYFLFLFFYFWE